jgi:hypothetical protein
MRNVYLEDAYVRLNQLETTLINEDVSRTSLENQINAIIILLNKSEQIKPQTTIRQAIDLLERGVTMARVLVDLRGWGRRRVFGDVNFPAPFSPLVAPSMPNFSYTPFVYQQTSNLWPKLTRPSQPRLYQILTLVRQAKNLVLQMIRYSSN